MKLPDARRVKLKNVLEYFQLFPSFAFQGNFVILMDIHQVEQWLLNTTFAY